jgi:hypothetical protein
MSKSKSSSPTKPESKSENKTATKSAAQSNRHYISCTFTQEQWAGLEKKASSVGMDVLELIQYSLDHIDEYIAELEKEAAARKLQAH